MMGGAGLVPMLLWTEWVSGGNVSTCVSPPPRWQREDGAGWKEVSCLSCLGGWGEWVGWG